MYKCVYRCGAQSLVYETEVHPLISLVFSGVKVFLLLLQALFQLQNM